MTLTTKLNQVIQKNREKIHNNQFVFSLNNEIGMKYFYCGLFDTLPDHLKLTVAMWVIEICPEEFSKFVRVDEDNMHLTLEEALKLAVYDTCMTYQALEEYYEELIK